MKTAEAHTPAADHARRALPMQQRAAAVQPATFDAERNTVQVCWTVGARTRRYDWMSDRAYEEELVVTPECVDMSRFDAGAVQVLDGHDRYSGVSAILGIADRGWLENGQGMAQIRLSQRPDLAGIVGDIRAGIIRDISFGYSVERYEITRAADRTDGVNLDLWRAVRWTPQEISFVAVPADPNAGTRATHSQYPCDFTRAARPAAASIAPPPTRPEPHMPEATTQGGSTAAPASTDPTRDLIAGSASAAQGDAVRAAIAAEQLRAADITDLCARHHLPELAAGFIRSGTTLEQAGLAVQQHVARRDAASGGHLNVRGIRTERDETETRLQGIEEALHHRCDPRVALTDNGRQYRGMTLLEIGRDHLESQGINTRGMDRLRLATIMMQHRGVALQTRDAAGSHTTSDFANLLANVATKRLRAGYDENPGTYMAWARRAPNLPDFKQITVAQLGAMPDLLQVNEAGEIKYGSFGDAGEKYNLLTYARIVTLSRQALINDDLRAFDRVVAGFGAAAARLENRTVYAQLTANANLADGVALFHSTHANNGTGAGSALQLSALVTGRTAMRTQKGLNSEELNLLPAFLIVPAALEQTAYTLTSNAYVPATIAAINEFRAGGRTALNPIVEPVLDATSAANWYLAANTSQIDTVEYAYLDGAEGPVIETEPGFEVDGISFKCREDFAAKVLDYRGLYRGVGS